jgi:hypothetical protein
MRSGAQPVTSCPPSVTCPKWAQVARQQVGQRGFARAVGADHGMDAVAPQVDRHVVHRGQSAEALGQVAGAEQGFTHEALLLQPQRGQRDQAQHAARRKHTTSTMNRPIHSCQCLPRFTPPMRGRSLNTCSTARSEGADDGAGKVAHAAQDHHHDGVGAHVKTHQLGVDVAGLHAPQVAGQPGQRAGQREGAELVAKGAKAHGAHAVLIDADARQRPAKRAPQQAAQEKA